MRGRAIQSRKPLGQSFVTSPTRRVTYQLPIHDDHPPATAPASWIEFHGLNPLGVTLADLEAIYGAAHRALTPAKQGTTVIFTAKPGSVAADAYVAARLWSPNAKPSALVSYLQLRYPR